MEQRTRVQIQLNVLTIILIGILLFSAIIALAGCDDNSTGSNIKIPSYTSDIPNRGGCVLLELTMTDSSKQLYWVSYYFKDQGFLILYNDHGFLIAIDMNYIANITETNYCAGR